MDLKDGMLTCKRRFQPPKPRVVANATLQTIYSSLFYSTVLLLQNTYSTVQYSTSERNEVGVEVFTVVEYVF